MDRAILSVPSKPFVQAPILAWLSSAKLVLGKYSGIFNYFSDVQFHSITSDEVGCDIFIAE